MGRGKRPSNRTSGKELPAAETTEGDDGDAGEGDDPLSSDAEAGAGEEQEDSDDEEQEEQEEEEEERPKRKAASQAPKPQSASQAAAAPSQSQKRKGHPPPADPPRKKKQILPDLPVAADPPAHDPAANVDPIQYLWSDGTDAAHPLDVTFLDTPELSAGCDLGQYQKHAALLIRKAVSSWNVAWDDAKLPSIFVRWDCCCSTHSTRGSPAGWRRSSSRCIADPVPKTRPSTSCFAT